MIIWPFFLWVNQIQGKRSKENLGGSTGVLIEKLTKVFSNVVLFKYYFCVLSYSKKKKRKKKMLPYSRKER